MNQPGATTKTKREKTSTAILRDILTELRFLRKEVLFLFPQDNLEDYEHPSRIKRSYREAMKQYPLGVIHVFT